MLIFKQCTLSLYFFNKDIYYMIHPWWKVSKILWDWCMMHSKIGVAVSQSQINTFSSRAAPDIKFFRGNINAHKLQKILTFPNQISKTKWLRITNYRKLYLKSFVFHSSPKVTIVSGAMNSLLLLVIDLYINRIIYKYIISVWLFSFNIWFMKFIFVSKFLFL